MYVGTIKVKIGINTQNVLNEIRIKLGQYQTLAEDKEKIDIS